MIIFACTLGNTNGKRSYEIEYVPSHQFLIAYSKYNFGFSMDELGFDFVSYSKGGFMNYWVNSGTIKGREPGGINW